MSLRTQLALEQAVFSHDRKYRYALSREWDAERPVCMFIGLNPSTADEVVNDPTIRRCIGFAQEWNCGALWMLNIFAFRATDPRKMKAQVDPTGPENDKWIRGCAAEVHYAHKGLVICAWGLHGFHKRRGAEVAMLLKNAGIPMLALGISGGGQPVHPLYQPKDLKPVTWELT